MLINNRESDVWYAIVESGTRQNRTAKDVIKQANDVCDAYRQRFLVTVIAKGKPGKRQFSKEGIEKIQAAQKRRWARVRKQAKAKTK